MRKLSPPLLVTLLALAFGAGLLAARFPILSPAPAAATLSLLPPTPFPSTATPPPTPTATAPDTGDVLETLYVEIAPRDLAQIEAKRAEALQLGILLSTGGDYVPATVRVGEQEVPVELRLKGDWINHIAHDKWSFRIRTVGEHYLFGMRVFSIHDPSMRSRLDEWLFLQNARIEGVLAVGYRFVHVVLNGEYQGIYALEEGFSKELLESQQRREGPIIRYDEDLVWEYRAFYDDQLIPRGVNDFYVIDEFQSGRIDADPILSAQRDAAVGLLRGLWSGERAAVEVFDVQAMARFLALSDLWSAPHGLIWHNLRYYYNPVTARLEPIAFDSDALAGELDLVGLPRSAFPNEPAMQRTILYGDAQLQAAYVQELERMSRPGYVEALEAQLGAQFAALRAALEPEVGPDVLSPPWDALRRRQELVRQVLNPHQMLYAYVQESGLTPILHIDVGNLLELPVEIVGLEMDGALLPAQTAWVAAESTGSIVETTTPPSDAVILQPLDPLAPYMPYVHLQIPRSELGHTADAPRLGIVTRLWGQTATLTQTVLPSYAGPLAQGPLPELPTLAQALDQHPYLQKVEGEDTLYIPGGTWEIDGNLVLPAGLGLRLGPGTTLRFGPETYLLATGPLDFRGSEDAPVVLQPSGETWQGVVVLQSRAPSSWQYVTVERASAVDQAGWTLTGGVTFYESPIRLAHSRIVDSQGEDGINVIRTQFEFVQSEFGPTVSDAFDGDFVQGTVEGCAFHDVGGDGIDVSGSDVQVRDVRLLNLGDKGISVGEGSRLTARDVTIETAGFGVVSKDLSQTTLDNVTISDVRLAGLAAYIKKPSYGPATMTANAIAFVDVPPERHTLVQTGSWIDLEGVRIWGTDVDVDALYGGQ